MYSDRDIYCVLTTVDAADNKRAISHNACIMRVAKVICIKSDGQLAFRIPLSHPTPPLPAVGFIAALMPPNYAIHNSNG